MGECSVVICGEFHMLVVIGIGSLSKANTSHSKLCVLQKFEMSRINDMKLNHM